MSESSVTFTGKITLGPEVKFSGRCHFQGETRIDSGSQLTNVNFGSGNIVRPYSILTDVAVGHDNVLGPFCFIRDNCTIENNCILGAHVEATRSKFGGGIKISHRAFVGDAEIGAQTIIGAGVVFCNFDGRGRQLTTIGNCVTVGSGCLLIPPLSIGDNVIIAAGSTVTKNVATGTKVIQKR